MGALLLPNTTRIVSGQSLSDEGERASAAFACSTLLAQDSLLGEPADFSRARRIHLGLAFSPPLASRPTMVPYHPIRHPSSAPP
jgi:hypothetical protein